MIQLHKLLIGFVMLTLIVAGISMFVANINSNYSPTGYNETQINSLNKIEELNNDIIRFENQSVKVGVDGENDVLGSMFTSAYTSSQILKGSISAGFSMINDGISNIPFLGSFGVTLKTVLTLMLIILVSIGIFLAFITKSERT